MSKLAAAADDTLAEADPREALLDAAEELIRSIDRHGLAAQLRARLQRMLPDLFETPAAAAPAMPDVQLGPVSVTGVDRELRLAGVVSALARLKGDAAARAFVDAELAAARASRTTRDHQPGSTRA